MIATGLDEPDRGLLELSDQEAVALLRNHHFGRLAFAHESWPLILPVNYVYDDPQVVVRTGPGAKLDEMPFHAVAFEVDDMDPAGEWGWSVLIQGPAFDITDATDERSVRLRGLVLESVAPGTRVNWLTVTAVRLSARYFGPKPLTAAP